MRKKIIGSLTKMPVVAFMVSSSILVGCSNQEEVAPEPLNTNATTEIRTSTTHTHYGPATPLGRGVARAWVQTTKSGEPLALGMNISAKALNSLPNEMTEFSLSLPKAVSIAPFETMTLDWNPMGHEPEHIYTLPHFDMHFYMISDEERMMIAPGPQTILPDSKYLPEMYVTDQFSIPMMGVHWINPLSPEWNGGIFTKTFIYGSYLENVIFYEPMITLAYLQSLAPGQTVVAEIPQPSQVQKSGYYPLKYSITYDPTPGEYIISLTDLRHREAQ